MKSNTKGPLLIVLSYLIWGLLPMYWKVMSDLNAVYILSSRVVWSLIFCALILALRHSFSSVKAVFKSKKELLLLIAAGFTITINWGSYIYAVNTGHLLDSSLAYYMNPILAILCGAVFFKEKLTVMQWISVALAAAAVIVPAISYGSIPWLSIIMALSFAIYGALKKLVVSDSNTSVFMETLSVCIFALGFIVFSECNGTGAIGTYSGFKLLLIPLTGVVTTVPLMLFAKGVKTTPYSVTGIIMYISPTANLLLGTLVYHEELTSPYIMAFIIVGVAVVIFVASMLIEGKRSRKKSAE